jgi:hypothetical protein
MTKGEVFRRFNMPRILAPFLVATLLSSCATPPLRTAYDPPPREGAALLVSEDNLSPGRMFLIGGISIYAAGIDGLPIRDARDRGSDPLPLRPGVRQVLVARYSGGSSGLIPIQLEAQAGETYFIRHEVEKVSGINSIFDIGRWFFWIEDHSGSRVTQSVEMSIQKTPQSTTIPIFIPKGK